MLDLIMELVIVLPTVFIIVAALLYIGILSHTITKVQLPPCY